MFEHSIKVPRHFKIAANILKKVSTEGGSVKTLLYDNKLRHFRTNVLYALILEAIKHSSDIDKIFVDSNLFATETRLDPWLAKILTAELLFGKKSLPGKSKPEQTILSYKEQFEKYTTDNQGDMKAEGPNRPRYVRINTNLLTTSDAISEFQEEGYRFIRCTSGSYDDYLKQIQALTENDFTQDYHVKTLFVFAPGTKFHNHQLYWDNKIILQDKATAMAVQLLAPPPGSVVLDMCAAPGMKTTQLAAFMRNQGKIYAVERNEKRFQTLCEFVEKTGSTCVQTMLKDSLEIRRGDCEDVEYILLDPSCSGSGMQFSIHNYVEDERLAKLTSLQEKFLKHAMNAFPKAKKIVYSTCSLYPEENERVITNIVKGSRAKWRVLDVKELLKGQWNNFGSAMYGSIGIRCMYAKPETDLTTGFFLAVLERDPKDVEKAVNRKEAYEKTSHNDSVVTDSLGQDNNEDVRYEDNLKKNKKKRREKNKEAQNYTSITNVDDDGEVGSGEPSKKKKKTKHKENDLDNFDNEVDGTEMDKGLKKKKKNKSKEEGDSDNLINNATESCEVATQRNEPKKKKKKNKNKIKDEYDLKSNTLIKNDVNYPEVDTEMHEQSDNKKKKHKSKEIEELGSSSNLCLHDTYEGNTPETNKLKKTKKKNKKESLNEGDIVIIDDNISPAAEQISKKKRKIKESSLPSLESENCPNPKKQRHKSKELCKQDCET